MNLSARDLLDDDLPADVAALLDDAGVPADVLELEITETAVMSDPEQAMRVLHGLRRLGVARAIDDYRAGNTSLGYLRSLPATMLKIDRSFVMSLDETSNQAIVNSTVQLGHSLGMRVVAEGVETETAFDYLRSLGCDAARATGSHDPGPLPTRWPRPRRSMSGWPHVSMPLSPELPVADPRRVCAPNLHWNPAGFLTR